MAGDWLKMRTRLGEEKAVLTICGITGLDRFAVVGRLHAFWSWAGEHTVTGKISDVTLKTVDQVTAHEGFGEAMKAAKWLEVTLEGGIAIPEWKVHNGKAAKERALASARQNRKRAGLSRKMSRTHRDASVTPPLPREEKRREEKKDTPNGVSGGETGKQIPPDIEAVKAYCLERGKGVNPHKWFAFYESKGWMIGKNKMKDWRAAVRNWENDDGTNGQANQHQRSSGANSGAQPASRVAVPPGALDKFKVRPPSPAGSSAGNLFGTGEAGTSG